jgi:hypothetical protein
MKASRPNECVDFLNSVFDFVVSIIRLDAQLKDKSVDFVHQKCDFDTVLEGVAYYGFSIDHHLCQSFSLE